LKPFQEIVGTLTKVEPSEAGQIKITFTMQREIELPASAIPLDKLVSVVGKRVGIFNLNS